MYCKKKQEFNRISNMLNVYTIKILNTIVRLSEMSALWIIGPSHPFLANFGPQNQNPDLLRIPIYHGF